MTDYGIDGRASVPTGEKTSLRRRLKTDSGMSPKLSTLHCASAEKRPQREANQLRPFSTEVKNA
jgi:hypothetical protein